MKIMRLMILNISILYTILFFLSCDKIIGPEIASNPRNYIWSMDTLSIPDNFQTSMYKVWGSSKNNIYAVGDNYSYAGIMFHYDGKKWSDVKLAKRQGGTLTRIGSLYYIFAFNDDDIWIAGTIDKYNPDPPPNFLPLSYMIHFDGKQWKEYEMYLGEGLMKIWGCAPDNIYAAGFGRYIWHYDGNIWLKESIPYNPDPKNNFQFTSFSGTKDGDLLGVAYSHDNELVKDSRYFFLRKNGKWNLVDSIDTDAPDPEARDYNFSKYWIAPDKNLYTFAKSGVYLWRGDKWEKAVTPFSINCPSFMSIFATSETNIFAVGLRGKVLHFNGTNWKQYTELADFNIDYTDVWSDGTEVFIVGQTNAKDGSAVSVILHGR